MKKLLLLLLFIQISFTSDSNEQEAKNTSYYKKIEKEIHEALNKRKILLKSSINKLKDEITKKYQPGYNELEFKKLCRLFAEINNPFNY